MFVFLFENAQAIIQSRVYKPEEFKTFAYELFDGYLFTVEAALLLII